MPGISIHVGVNATKAPGISVQSLFGCENDAESMRILARARQFAPLDDGGPDVPIIREKATFENVLGKIRLAADKLVAGDTFLFTFSGHGTRRGAEDPTETDFKDETLVLHDKLLVDNVLRRRLWPKFKKGVRVVMVSDSCHSGGLAMAVMDNSESETAAVASSSGSPRRGSSVDSVPRSAIPTRTPVAWQPTPRNGFRVRTIPESQAEQHFELLKTFYKELRDSLPPAAPPLDATVLLLAACEEFETTKDGLPNGVFTQALIDVLSANGAQTYNELKVNIRAKLQQASNPVVRVIGPPEFADTEAFKI